MVLEIAQIDIKPGFESQFEAGVAKAGPIFARSPGCRSMELHRSTEYPNRYRLFVEWDSVEAHTVDFRNSENFKQWRELVAHCFEIAPVVEHTTRVVKGF